MVYNWNIGFHNNCHSTNDRYFLSCNSCNGNTTYTGKTANFRQWINNHITAYHYRTSTDKFDNHVFKCSNKNEHVAKEPYLKFMLLWQSIIMKINCYLMNLTYIKWDLIQWTGNCFNVIAAAVYIRIICIIETLHYWRNLETLLVKMLTLNIYLFCM